MTSVRSTHQNQFNWYCIFTLFLHSCSWSSEAEQAADRYRHQLGRRPPPRQEVRGLRFLLRQRYRTGHPWVTQVSWASPLPSFCTQPSCFSSPLTGFLFSWTIKGIWHVHFWYGLAGLHLHLPWSFMSETHNQTILLSMPNTRMLPLSFSFFLSSCLFKDDNKCLIMVAPHPPI